MDPLRQLEAIVGAERVIRDPAALAEASRDRTEADAAPPDAIVKIASRDELVAVVRVAAGARAPLVPRVAGTNIGGLALAARGGWILDLTAMDRILELHEEDLIAVIEPGVTFGQLAARLRTLSPPLTIGFPLSPPEASVVANCLLDGLGNLSLRHGAMGEWITGLEAVRADGTLVKTGAWAAGVPVPFSRAPLPDLTGLFVSAQGTTGIVTRLGVELWPAPLRRERLFLMAWRREAAVRAIRELPRLDVLDDLGALSWPTGKLLFGVTHPAERDPAEPEFFVYVDLGAQDEGVLAARKKALLRWVRERGEGLDAPIDVASLVRLEPRLAPLAEFPTRLDFLLDHPDRGLTWVGTYGPLSRFQVGLERGLEIVATHGFPPIVVARPMKGGHYGVLRFIQLFRHDDEADRGRVAACNAALCDALRETGFVMYKTPGWAVRRYRGALDPGFVRLLGEVRGLLDPTHILNPGRWEVD